MKKYVLPLLLLGGCLCLSGCKAQRSYEPAPSVAAPSVTALEQPFRQMSGNPDGMALYSACTFSYGGQDWATAAISSSGWCPAVRMLPCCWTSRCSWVFRRRTCGWTSRSSFM